VVVFFGKRPGATTPEPWSVVTAMTTTNSLDKSASPDAPYTNHVEPIEQGGEPYIRCKECEAELLTRLGGWDNLVHKQQCSHYDR